MHNITHFIDERAFGLCRGDGSSYRNASRDESVETGDEYVETRDESIKAREKNTTIISWYRIKLST